MVINQINNIMLSTLSNIRRKINTVVRSGGPEYRTVNIMGGRGVHILKYEEESSEITRALLFPS